MNFMMALILICYAMMNIKINLDFTNIKLIGIEGL